MREKQECLDSKPPKRTAGFLLTQTAVVTLAIAGAVVATFGGCAGSQTLGRGYNQRRSPASMVRNLQTLGRGYSQRRYYSGPGPVRRTLENIGERIEEITEPEETPAPPGPLFPSVATSNNLDRLPASQGESP